MFTNKINKEAIIGIIVTISIFAIIAALTGIYGILYLGLGLVAAVISLNLFFRNSIVAKTSAVVISPSIIYKVLMPNKYKKELKELEEKENNEKT